jgi:hypothetical protein
MDEHAARGRGIRWEGHAEQALFAAGRDDGTQVEEGWARPAIQKTRMSRLIHDVAAPGRPGRTRHSND